MSRFPLSNFALWTVLLGTGGVFADPSPERYNVEWTTPSQDSSGSMPLGNGDIGLNVWVEPGGDVLFYLAKTDAWSENCRLLKLGRVRAHITPSPFVNADAFSQTLDLKAGSITISSRILHLAV